MANEIAGLAFLTRVAANVYLVDIYTSVSSGNHDSVYITE